MKPQDFKKLQAEWDRKLRKSGFRDIEDRRHPYQMTRDSLNDVKKHLRADMVRGVDESGASYAFSPTAQYFGHLQQFVHEYKFKTKGDAFCFEQYADGKKPAETWRAMKSRFPKWTYWRVRYSIEQSMKAYKEWINAGRRSD